MSKEQINYLLALATLLVVWLYFNTFFVSARKNFGGMMPPSAGRSMNSMGMTNIPQPPNMAELLKNQPRGGQTQNAPEGMPPAPPQASKTDNASK